MNEFNLSDYLENKTAQVNKALENVLNGLSSRIAEAMRYSLMAGGKRIRPILCIASAEAAAPVSNVVKPDYQCVLQAACAIEMIHTYSLIHDDLPAMDNDELRRGKPTCHIAFDEATAILAGDALLTLAFTHLSEIPCKTITESKALLTVISRISQAAGYNGMIEGQMQDIASEGVKLKADALESMHALKTGAMISASVFTGAVFGCATPEQIANLEVYAKKIGLAFQVADDILNVEGDPALMGKAAGTDKSRNKNTYPSIIGMNESKTLAKNLIAEALNSIDIFDEKANPLRAIAKYLIERKR